MDMRSAGSKQSWRSVLVFMLEIYFKTQPFQTNENASTPPYIFMT
jgi:hypothetical protein